MYKILCYGDSNTWGIDADIFLNGNGHIQRFTNTWPEILQKKLGNKYKIITDALNGRTINTDDPEWPDRNGLKDIAITIEKHYPLDIIIIALGLNDTKYKYKLTARQTAADMATLVKCIRTSPWITTATKILIIAPYIIKHEETYNAELKQATPKLQALPELIAKNEVCKKELLLDPNKLKLELSKDGMHFTKDDHLLFANEVSKHIKRLSH